jgi:type I restriction enzyme M protein
LCTIYRGRFQELRKVLLVYAARHFRELSAQNELRPQDVMRILVHVQAYGDAAKVPGLVAQHSGRIREQINAREFDEVERLEAEYADTGARLAKLQTEVAEKRAELEKLTAKTARDKVEAGLVKLEAQRDKVAVKIAERDEKIAESRRRADDDRRDVDVVGKELGALYGDADELLKHARVVGLDEIEENEFNLNIPRYVDTFEPEPRVAVKDALKALGDAHKTLVAAETALNNMLKGIGYAT